MLGVRRPSTVPMAGDDGVVRHVPLAEWRTFHLPELVKQFWTRPDELAHLIECALDAGLHAEVLPAAEQLSRVDPDRERRYGLPAIALARNGLFSKAEELLDRHESLWGITAFGLHARAEVSLSGNRRAKGQGLLCESLRLEPDANAPLRRLVDEAGRDGPAAVEAAVRSIAGIAGSWRAKLLLASSFVEDPAEILGLVKDAVEQSRDEREVLTRASSVLASREMTAALIDFIGPRYQLDRDRPACGVNLLYALLASGAKVQGEALLGKLAPRLEAGGFGDYARFYGTAFKNLRDGGKEGASEPDIELLKAMSAASRRGSARAWRACWAKLSRARLLVPVKRAWIEVPVLESPWPDGDQLLEIVTGIDSEGREVVLAFTDERTLRAWGPMRSPCIPMDTPALLAIVADARQCTLLVNPAGPSATELALADIEAFLDGRAPEGVDSRIRYLAEPLRRDVPKAFMERLGGFLGESRIVRQAWLFEMVDDRSGVNPAVAVEFVPEASQSDERDLLIDAADGVRWDSRRSRRVRFIPLEEGRFADYLRAVGVPIRIA